MANYADDCSPYECSDSIDEVIQKLESDSRYLIEWYENNYLVPNPDKWHLLLSESGDNLLVNVGNKCISNSSEENILGVYFDNKLNFNSHLVKLCKRASQKLHALARVSNFMGCEQRKIIMNAFISSQFCYCPLLWMCHSRSIHTRINRIHERSLRIVYSDDVSSFEQLLEKSGSVSIHHRNLQLLAIEIYKAINNLSSSLMSDIFKIKERKYNLRKESTLVLNKFRTTRYGINSISYLGPKIWDLIPDDIKKCCTLNGFKQKIKLWTPVSCPCVLCKVYIPNLGYI